MRVESGYQMRNWWRTTKEGGDENASALVAPSKLAGTAAGKTFAPIEVRGRSTNGAVATVVSVASESCRTFGVVSLQLSPQQGIEACMRVVAFVEGCEQHAAAAGIAARNRTDATMIAAPNRLINSLPNGFTVNGTPK